MGTGLTPGRTATPELPVVPAEPSRYAGPTSASPFPVDSVAVLASPRACHTSAPPRGMVVENAFNGATESASRGGQAVGLALAARVIFTSTGTTKDTWQSRVPQSPRASRKPQRCRICTDAAGDGTKGTWGDIFGTEDEATDRMSGSEEVVSHPSTSLGTNRTHGVLRDSGVAELTDPGASLLRWTRDAQIPVNTEHGNKRSSCWLLGGGFWGGCKTHPKTQSAPRDRRTT